MNTFPVKVTIDDSEVRAAMARMRAGVEAEVLPDVRRLAWLGVDPVRLEDVRGIMLNESLELAPAIDLLMLRDAPKPVETRGDGAFPSEHPWWKETCAKLAEAGDALLATLPRCHACRHPATRVFVGPDVPVAESYKLEPGKSFVPRPYTGPSLGAHLYRAPDGRWEWMACDDPDHVMPGSVKHRDLPIAHAVRTIEGLGRK